MTVIRHGLYSRILKKQGLSIIPYVVIYFIKAKVWSRRRPTLRLYFTTVYLYPLSNGERSLPAEESTPYARTLLVRLLYRYPLSGSEIREHLQRTIHTKKVRYG